MAKLLKRGLPVLVLAFFFVMPVARSGACPFCNQEGKTLTGEVKDATMVLYGELTNANPASDTTDIVIDTVIKTPEKAALAAKVGKGKTITLRGYHPTDTKDQYRYLVFCDEFKDGIDPYYGVAVKKDSDIAKYLKAALEIRDEKQPKRLRFFFDYLDNADAEVSNDALKEFAKADYADYKDMAKTLPPDKIVKWLEDPKTPAFRYGLYASLLGHCGKAEHAEVLRKMLDDKDKLVGAGIDGIMAAYTMLKPKEGWEFIAASMRDPKKHFMVRYNALKAVRFIWVYRPDLAKKKDMIEGVASLITQEDIADMAIEDLRKWQCWDLADRILALRTHKVYETPIVRRSVLRFALDCKANNACTAYVAEMRRKTPRWCATRRNCCACRKRPANKGRHGDRETRREGEKMMSLRTRFGKCNRAGLALLLLLSPCLLVSLSPCLARACSLCANQQQVPTFRQEAAQPNAHMILYGTFQNPQASGTEFHIEKVLRSDKFIEGKKVVIVPKYIPSEKDPKPFLLFADVFKDNLDAYRGVPIKTAEGVEYVKRMLKLDPKNTTENLEFFFKYLDSADKEVSNDAFMEFVKASDVQIGAVAKKLPADKLRTWLKDKETPPERVGLYSFLLGACGNQDDAKLLAEMLHNNSERTTKAFDGILAGYINLQPKEGWDLALTTLGDDKQSFEVRLGVVRMMRFCYLAHPKESKDQVLKGMASMLVRSDLADVAIEDLRRLKIYDLTPEVLGLYGKKGYEGQLMRETIIRYALSCKDDAAAVKFLAQRRQAEPDLVRDVEDAMRFEKPK